LRRYDKINTVAITSDGHHIISGSDDNTLKIWNLATREVIATFFGDGSINCFAASPDGKTILAGDSAGRVHFLRLEGRI
jgi:WD40 repeat protein